MPDRCVALFCGSRNWTDYVPVAADIGDLPKHAVVVHGGAKGLDRIAGDIAHARCLHVATIYPMWGWFGGAAGPKRNEALLALLPTVVYAYPIGESKGTRGMIAMAEKAGIDVIVREGAGSPKA